MHRQENLTLDRDFPTFPPYKAVADYRFSLNATREFYPAYDWDKPKNHVNQNLNEARRELADIEEQLKDKREQLKELRENLKQQWNDLEMDQTNLKMNLQKFHKFIRSNEEKRKRALISLEDTRKNYVIIDQKITELRQEYEYLENIKKEMDQRIEENRIYEAYLDKVIPLMPGISNLNQLINRYEALLEARQFLIIRQENNLKSLEDYKKNALRIIEEYSTKVVGLSTQVAHLQSGHQYATQQTIMWVKIVDKIRMDIFNRLLVKDQILHSVYNLYLLMCKRKQIEPEYQMHEYEQQLNFIKKTLEETKRIREILVEKNIEERKVNYCIAVVSK